ncbi:carcinoembryonic antigen-related cell adhesion molecule 5-like [Chionomys nivalis]|uniref:carcinoembryonic antigen-related cell adhesion molecule 5-like n=1 Tax=Chionomys nivalis TaxID=269649 RepID=UPI002596F1D4|nr:carcinoembryonic antigen-related cell adhesion molecule 5-like [Chionomys nivalis]
MYLYVQGPHSQSCNPFASSRLMIQPVPRDAAEGEDIVLQVYNLPEDLKAFSWHRATYRAPTLTIVKYNRATNSISWGPEHRIRKTLYSNGSLILRDLTKKDAGIYTLIVLDKDFKIERLYGEFFIKKNVTQPFVQITDTTVSGGTSVIFTCISPDTDVSIRWIYNEKNLQLTERMTLSPTKCGLKIDPVRSEDAGEYRSSLLTSWYLSSTASVTIEFLPTPVAEGDNVLFLVHNLPEDIIDITWFKGLEKEKQPIALYVPHKNLSIPGPMHSGREIIYHNGSLLLEKVTQKDAGFYSLRTYTRRRKFVSTIPMYLHVHASNSQFCNPFTSSQLMVQPVPHYAAEGEDVVLQVYNLPEDLKAFSWHKATYRTPVFKVVKYTRATNSKSWGPKRRIKKTGYNNGSLILRDLTEKDAGVYTLTVLKKDFKIERLYVEFYVKKNVTQPFVQITDTTVTGGTSVIFTCISPDTDVSIRWIFNEKNLQLTERMTLSPTKCGLKIDPVRNEDAGEYRCEVSNQGMADFKNIVATRFIQDMKATLWGPAYSGRETLHSDGSLLLHGVTQKDCGLYILKIMRTDKRSEYTQVQLQVDSPHSQFCNPFTSSRLMVQPVPRYAAEGEDVVLQVYNLPEDLKAFYWHKATYRTPVLKIVKYTRATNSKSWGPKQRIKKTGYNNGSLILQDLTEKDAGVYTLTVLKKDFKIERLYVEFYVKKNVTQPFVQITDTTVTGGTSVIFTCISPDTDVSIRWIFNEKNLQLTERMTLSPTKCGLKIDPVMSEDAGEYRCEVSNQVSSKTSHPVSWGHHK